ncbi:MAG TPA: cytochrome b5 domain-containing protein [Mobilitalea sp.]|nr:cytochrome b5 domain-containing protein [Mobilitalea sp.]
MDEFELRRILYDYIKEICHYSQMQVFSTSIYQKNYFQLQIDEAISDMINFIQSYSNRTDNNEAIAPMQLQQGNPAQTRQNDSDPVVGEPGLQAPPGSNVNCIPAPEPKLRVISPEELADNDGSNGKPAYVAVNGNVYDVTDAIRWAGGTHFGLYSGRDLSNEFMACHNGMSDILKMLPQIGTIL